MIRWVARAVSPFVVLHCPSCDKGSFNRCCLPQSPCLRTKPSEFLLSAKASSSRPRFLVSLLEETKFSERTELERGPMSARTLLVVIVGLAAVIQDLGWRRISNWTSG